MLKSLHRRFLALVIASILLFGLMTFNVLTGRDFLGLPVAYGQGVGEPDLASSPSECGTDQNFNTPKNCLFLEEPIGGKPGFDLYIVACTQLTEKEGGGTGCAYSIWSGGTVPPGAHGPVQAILTFDPDKPYQGPFGLLYSYLGLVYGYMSGLIVGLVVLFIVIGGVQMITSAGQQDKYDAGKKRIVQALIGMVLWFTASLILYTINPTFFAF